MEKSVAFPVSIDKMVARDVGVSIPDFYNILSGFFSREQWDRHH